MSRNRYNQDDIRDIQSMEDVRYHKMRLELSTEFLEDKLDDNVTSIKRQLSPRYLFRTIITTAVSFFGNRTTKQSNDDETAEDTGPDTTAVLLDGFIAIVKALFRAGG